MLLAKPDPRREVHVHSPNRSFEAITIRHVPAPRFDDELVPIFTAFDAGDVLVASSFDARALAKWAFSNGALTVRHDYDLMLAEAEAA